MRLAAALLALLLAGCMGTPQTAPPPQAPALVNEALDFTDQDGTLLALPAVGGTADFTYEVPAGARWLAATLTWQTRGTTLTLTGADPSGAEQGESRTLAGTGPRSPARLDWWAPSPAAGTWTFTVRGDAALQEPVRLQFHTAEQVHGMHVAQRTQVAPTGFVEVNLEMKAGQTMRFEWSAASPVYFNIHTHRDGVTTNVVEETTDAMEANFTADEDGGYSLLWAQQAEGAPAPVPPPGGSPVDLEYRVDGAFELHSAVG